MQKQDVFLLASCLLALIDYLHCLLVRAFVHRNIRETGVGTWGHGWTVRCVMCAIHHTYLVS